MGELDEQGEGRGKGGRKIRGESFEEKREENRAGWRWRSRDKVEELVLK